MMPRPRHSALRRRRDAFTLLELVIALAMVGVIGVSLYTALSIAFRARDTARRQTEVVREAMIAMEVMGHELANALPPAADSRLAGPFVGLATGTPDAPNGSIEFYALGHHAINTGDEAVDDPLSDGPRWVQLALIAGEDSSSSLVRRVERNLLASVENEPGNEVLLTNVRAFGLRFFTGLDWVDEWDSTLYGDSLPLAVEVTIEMNAPSPHDPIQPYRATHVIPLPCARPDLIAQTAP